MRKPSQKQLQNQLVSAYNKAYKVYSDLNKAGFNFTKTHEKVMSFERLTKKLTSGKITKKDVQFYKDKAKKTNENIIILLIFIIHIFFCPTKVVINFGIVCGFRIFILTLQLD